MVAAGRRTAGGRRASTAAAAAVVAVLSLTAAGCGSGSGTVADPTVPGSSPANAGVGVTSAPTVSAPSASPTDTASGLGGTTSASPTPSTTMAMGSQSPSPDPTSTDATTTGGAQASGAQLPGGGTVMFPGRRLVAMYGAPGTPSLGVLGEQGITASIARVERLAAAYRPLSDVPVVPTFEIIATVASSSSGRDGDYSSESTVAQLQPWVDAAGKAGVYVVLDLQPGRADLLQQAKLYAPLLQRPYVGLALDPEWKLKAGQRPLRQIGGVDASEVNSVISWLSDLTANQGLPQKLLVLHQFKLSMLRDESDIDVHDPHVSVLIHMDGQGGTSLKDGTWRSVVQAAPKGVAFGWKNFYDEDSPMLTPRQTMARKPTPVMISYQ